MSAKSAASVVECLSKSAVSVGCLPKVLLVLLSAKSAVSFIECLPKVPLVLSVCQKVLLVLSVCQKVQLVLLSVCKKCRQC